MDPAQEPRLKARHPRQAEENKEADCDENPLQEALEMGLQKRHEPHYTVRLPHVLHVYQELSTSLFDRAIGSCVTSSSNSLTSRVFNALSGFASFRLPCSEISPFPAGTRAPGSESTSDAAYYKCGSARDGRVSAARPAS